MQIQVYDRNRWKHKYMHTTLHLPHRIVLAIAVPVEDLNLQGAVAIVVAKGYHGDLYRSPDGIQGIVNALAFPHHGVGVVLV
jgi:hypothetical protein